MKVLITGLVLFVTVLQARSQDYLETYAGEFKAIDYVELLNDGILNFDPKSLSNRTVLVHYDYYHYRWRCITSPLIS